MAAGLQRDGGVVSGSGRPQTGSIAAAMAVAVAAPQLDPFTGLFLAEGGGKEWGR
jgi:hypothetical protein